MAHRFRVGDLVEMVRAPSVYSVSGPCEVVRLLPAIDDVPQYRIKGDREEHERVVKETELKRYLG